MTPKELVEVKAAIEEALYPITIEMGAFRKILFGNGEAGVCEQLRGIKEFIATLKAAPKTTWILVSQIVTWGLVLYLAWKK
jgi:hypothetical protein